MPDDQFVGLRANRRLYRPPFTQPTARVVLLPFSTTRNCYLSAKLLSNCDRDTLRVLEQILRIEMFLEIH